MKKSPWQNKTFLHYKNKTLKNWIKKEGIKAQSQCYMINPEPTFYWMRKSWNFFLLRSRARKECNYSMLLFSVVVTYFARATKRETKIKWIQIGNEEVKNPCLRMTWFFTWKSKDSTIRLSKVVRVFQIVEWGINSCIYKYWITQCWQCHFLQCWHPRGTGVPVPTYSNPAPS